MVLELLERIRRQEEQAQRVRFDAQREGRGLLKAAGEECAALERAAAEEDRAFHKRFMEKRRQEISAAIGAKEGQREAARQALRARAEAKIEETARRIAAGVLGHGDR